MADLTTLTASLSTMKQAMVDRLVAQGDTTIQNNDTMQTIVNHYEQLRKINNQSLTITENGTYVKSGDYTGLNNIVVNVPEGGPATHKKFALLDRVYEDIDGTAIGTVVGFHTDAQGVEYAVVALDAQYRSASGSYMSSTGSIADLPTYSNAGVYGARETATFNCDKILAQATASGWTSSAVEHCRNQSFTIDGATYAGQLPTLMELLKVLEWREAVNAADTTAESNPTLIVPNNQNMWSSSQNSSNNGWLVYNYGNTNTDNKTNAYFVLPVLEIPNA